MNELDQKIAELKELAAKSNIDISSEIRLLQAKLGPKDQSQGVKTAWQRVELARNPNRPTTLDYIERISEQFIELHGDRGFADDLAMVGGIARIGGIPFTFIGHQKGKNMKENLIRNYGYAKPEGYRKALRLAKQAEKFKRPIVTFIDTAGAFPGIESEERGISEAIARNLKEFSVLKTPIICIVIGEGGSGGAIGIGVGDRVFMLENSTYAVISPEGCASILLRDSSKAQTAAELMKLTSYDLQSFGIIDGVLPEPTEGAHTAPDLMASRLKELILVTYKELSQKRLEVLLRERSKRLLEFGSFNVEGEQRETFLSRFFNFAFPLRTN
jgi:acetyl-CoA carboxylase carboxyl transferase subunit alpha